MRRSVWLAATVATGLVGSSAWADPFAGRSYTISVTPTTEARQGGARPFGEEVSFRQGRLSAAAFAMYGFVPAGYTLTTNDQGVTTFHATLDGGDRGTLVWTGTANSAGFSGILVWTRPDSTPVVYPASASQIASWYDLGLDELACPNNCILLPLGHVPASD